MLTRIPPTGSGSFGSDRFRELIDTGHDIAALWCVGKIPCELLQAWVYALCSAV